MTLLPDVNVLVSLLWESHLHHNAARRWFAHREVPWATCAITQTGFVRVSANPVVLPEAIPVQQAVATLAELVARPDHRFLTDGLGFVDNTLIPHDRLIGHRQVTDAHLLSIARQHAATIATFDRGLAILGGDTVQLIDEQPIGENKEP